MSNLVLYRKYRPQLFADVAGQDHVKTTLLNAIEKDKVAHAYLFCGPRGCGKTTVARLLAKAVNCEEKSSPEPCNKCSSCLDILHNKSMDIIEIDAASHRGIDEVRELREGVRFGPTKGRYKVFILDEAHQLTSGAANALLKVLEEAPEHAIFILATTESQKMISTIISRCQRFDFHKISVPEMIDRLNKISKKEKVKIKEDVLKMIASVSEGALRDAEGLLSQVISFTSKEGEITKDDAKSILGIMERGIIANFAELIIRKDAVEALSIIEKSLFEGITPEIFYDSVSQHLRDMMLVKILIKSKSIDSPNSITETLLTRITKEDFDYIKKQVESIEIEDIKQIIDYFYFAGQRIKYSPIPQLPLEIAVIESIERLKKRNE